MWAIRKASVRINHTLMLSRFQPFSSVTFRASYAKSDTSSSSYTYKTGFNVPPHISDRSLTLKRFYTQNSLIGKPRYSSKHDATGDVISEAGPFQFEDEDDDIDVGVPQNEGDVSQNLQGRRASSELFNAIIDSSSMSVKEAVEKWVEKGNDLSKMEISFVMSKLRKQRMYQKAFQLSEWVEAHENVEFGERDYATRVHLIAKLWGLQNAENYIEENIPESFRGLSVYQALLASYVFYKKATKAEQVFNKIKELKLPITTFSCNQMLHLYASIDTNKMVDVLLLMEKENIKPSLVTYTFLIGAKGKSGDLAGMEQILEDMKGEGLEPDLKFQIVLARHYVKLGIIEKAKAVLKEMEGHKLNEKRWVCSHLLPIYASLGSPDDVKRVWEVCEIDLQLHECMSAIDAFGKLKKVEKAEAVFDKMSKIWKPLWAKHYTAMLKVYTYNKMFSEGKNLVKRINESGCTIGPDIVDALVKFYIEAEEIEEAGLILNMAPPRIKGKPLFATYLMILDEYARRGDVENAEKIIARMRHDGYALRFRPYNSLLQAYINAKLPAYGFKRRMEADGVFPGSSMEARIAQVDR